MLDWPPHPSGDKLLLIFNGRTLTNDDLKALDLQTAEISEARFFGVEELASLMPARLARRVTYAAQRDTAAYLEHGRSVDPSP